MGLQIFKLIDGKVKTNSQYKGLGPKDVVLITGGSKGLGCEMVKQLIEQYYVKKVYVLDIVPVEYTQENVLYYSCDVGRKQDLIDTIKGIMKECKDNGDNISVFINNAGIRHHKSILLLEDADIEKLYNINLFSFIWSIRMIVKDFIKNWEHQNKTLSIVTVSSVLGSLAPRNLSIYSSTKAALTQVHEGLDLELNKHPLINNLLVLPGQLSVGMFDDVNPSRQFFAPLVDHIELTEEILHAVNRGQCGVLARPLYGRFLPLVKTLPYSLVRMCRYFSQMDDKVRDEMHDKVRDD